MNADRSTSFALGVISGGLAVAKWRPILKESIKLLTKGGRQVRQISARGIENLADIHADARYEMEFAHGNDPAAGRPEEGRGRTDRGDPDE